MCLFSTLFQALCGWCERRECHSIATPLRREICTSSLKSSSLRTTGSVLRNLRYGARVCRHTCFLVLSGLLAYEGICTSPHLVELAVNQTLITLLNKVETKSAEIFCYQVEIKYASVTAEELACFYSVFVFVWHCDIFPRNGPQRSNYSPSS